MTDTTHLCLIMEPLAVVFNNRSVRITTEHKADFQKRILHFQASGCLLRFNWLASEVAYLRGSGGVHGRRAETELREANALARKYPRFISRVVGRKDGSTTLQLQPLTARVRHMAVGRTLKAMAQARKSRLQARGGARKTPGCPYPFCGARGSSVIRWCLRKHQFKCKRCMRKFTVRR